MFTGLPHSPWRAQIQTWEPWPCSGAWADVGQWPRFPLRTLATFFSFRFLASGIFSWLASTPFHSTSCTRVHLWFWSLVYLHITIYYCVTRARRECSGFLLFGMKGNCVCVWKENFLCMYIQIKCRVVSQGLGNLVYVCIKISCSCLFCPPHPFFGAWRPASTWTWKHICDFSQVYGNGQSTTSITW